MVYRKGFVQCCCGIAVLSLLGGMACAQAPTREPVSDGTRMAYEQRCALCHGVDGDGSGPHAASLPVRPANWTNDTVQLSDDQLRRVILDGGAAIGKSSAMPPNPDLQSSRTLDEMVALIRSFDR